MKWVVVLLVVVGACGPSRVEDPVRLEAQALLREGRALAPLRDGEDPAGRFRCGERAAALRQRVRMFAAAATDQTLREVAPQLATCASCSSEATQACAAAGRVLAR